MSALPISWLIPGHGSSARRSCCPPVSSATSTTTMRRSTSIARKKQIKDAPEFDDSMIHDEEYRTRLGSYYGPGGVGYRDGEDSSVR